MKDKLLRNFKSFFAKPEPLTVPAVPVRAPAATPPTHPSPDKPRIVSFESNKSEQLSEEARAINENRYDKLEAIPELSKLDLVDRPWPGQTAVLYEKSRLSLKAGEVWYDNIVLLATDYRVVVKTATQRIEFELGKLEKLYRYSNNENTFKLAIVLKDGRFFKLSTLYEEVLRRVSDQIDRFAFVTVKNKFFAYRHFQFNRQLEMRHSGWDRYDILSDFRRMGLTFDQDCDLKVVDNSSGRICSTYSSLIVVPARLPQDNLNRCAKFRSRNRLPALTFAFQNPTIKQFSYIFRSSQSKIGVGNSRSDDDQLMLRLIGNPKMDPNNPSLIRQADCIIYDARGYMAALGNKLSGKGFESEEFYINCKLQFLNIPNIHAVRESYQKMLKVWSEEDSKYWSIVAESQWYDFVFLILQGASSVAKNIAEGKNVLVHCSDGWDRTAQLCSLSALMLDPYYRTRVGFEALIDKDWVMFGHQFCVRFSQGMNAPKSQERSQVFLQFLDCVSQLLHQFPTSFEFNFRYLYQIAELSHTHAFGNFLCNNELEMIASEVRTNTISLWSYTAEHANLFTNAFYQPPVGPQSGPLLFSTAQKTLRVWREHFLQFVPEGRDIYSLDHFKFTHENKEMLYRQLREQIKLLDEQHQQQMLKIAQLSQKDALLRKRREEQKKEIEEAATQFQTAQPVASLSNQPETETIIHNYSQLSTTMPEECQVSQAHAPRLPQESSQRSEPNEPINAPCINNIEDKQQNSGEQIGFNLAQQTIEITQQSSCQPSEEEHKQANDNQGEGESISTNLCLDSYSVVVPRINVEVNQTMEEEIQQWSALQAEWAKPSHGANQEVPVQSDTYSNQLPSEPIQKEQNEPNQVQLGEIGSTETDTVCKTLLEQGDSQNI